VLFWATGVPESRLALESVAREREALARAGVEVLAVALDAPGDEPKVRAAAQGLALPVIVAPEEMAGTYSILSRYLYDRREDLPVPTLLLMSAQGEVVKVYRDSIAASEVLMDIPRIEASPAERLARAVPFAGTFYSAPGERNYFQYALELSEQGFDAAAVVAFELAAKLDPSAITFYNLGTLYAKAGQPSQGRLAFERALQLEPNYAEASNSLGALLAQSGDIPGALARFRAALQSKPEFADALNNLGFALFQTGEGAKAHELYERALGLQPDFPEAFNNLGILFGQQGDLERAESFFKQAVDKRPAYGEASNNLALVLEARGDTAGAVAVLQRLLRENPGFEAAYVTLCRIYLGAGREKEGLQVLEQLLQRNPKHPQGLEILRKLRPGG